MVIKCKMCGGDIEFIPGATYGTCEYCGSTSTIPKADDEQKLNRYNRANHYRRQCEFDKAVAAYEKILEQDDTDAEAHWGAVLSRFGIEYVEDPATGKRIPTCHRVQVASILTDDDYLAALKYAPDAESRRLYEEQAAQIADIQKNILAISANEKPYDVFICYKETGEDGQRTRDSQWAQEVYYGLTEQGYKVFFSRITLEDKLGQQYEPYIFAALNSAKVMVVIGSKPEYFNAVWVKNEWSRYLALMKNDRKRLLIPCYRGMDPYDLPEELSNLQSQDMSKIGFMQDLLRGIQKVLSAEKQPEQPKVIIQQAAAPAAPVMDANLTALIKRGNMALVDHEWRKADEFFEKALNLDAENAEAYMGKFLARKKKNSMEGWAETFAKQTFQPDTLTLNLTDEQQQHITVAMRQNTVQGYLNSAEISQLYPKKQTYASNVNDEKNNLNWMRQDCEDKDFVRAMQFAQGEVKTRYDAAMAALNAKLNQRLEDARAQEMQNIREAQEKLDKAFNEADAKTAKIKESAIRKRDQELESKYQDCCHRMSSAKSEFYYREVRHAFEALGDYKDSREKARECERLAQKWLDDQAAEEARKKRNKIIAVIAVVVVFAIAAIMKFVIIPDTQYKAATEMAQNGQYDEAIAAFKAAGDYSDAATKVKELQYQKGENLLAADDYDGAIAAYQAAGDYSDAATKAKELQYQKGESLLTEQDSEAAAQAFASGAGYRDAIKRSYQICYQDLHEGKIAAGSYHTVGLKADGMVVAAGRNKYGQCNVRDWTDIVSIAAGDDHTVGLKTDGTVVAAGENDDGQCNVRDWMDIVSIAAGNVHTVGLKADGTVVATGWNKYGQCEVSDWTDIVSIAAGSYHTVGLKADGTVVAAGDNGSGQCNVSDWRDIVAVATGRSCTVGLKSDGTVVAAGYNWYGQCDVRGWTDIVCVVTGDFHTVGLKTDGTVVATGKNDDGQCNVSDWRDIVSIAAGDDHTVGLKADGTVVAAGKNWEGQCDVSGWTDIGGRRTLQ